MDLNLDDAEVSFAMRTVRAAARLGRRIHAGMARANSPMNLTKQDCSPVTVADFSIQALVSRALAGSFPGEPLVAEERSAELRRSEAVLETVTWFVNESGLPASADDVCEWIDRGASNPGERFWTLDPIDGTKGYLRGGQYAVALALLVDGVVEVGVLGCPNLGERSVPVDNGPGVLVVARRGQGAWQIPLDGAASLAPMRVSECRDAARARVLRSYEAAHTNVSELDMLVHLMGIQVEPVRMDSQAKYAVLAAGNGEFLLRLLSPSQRDYREKVWDHAAGSIVVEEAGGRVSDLDGRPLDFTAGRSLTRNRGLVASNGYVNDTVLDALARLGEE